MIGPVLRRGSAAALHARPLDAVPTPAWEHLVVDGPAVVVGSTQRLDGVRVERAARRGVEVARRRSGGGAVWLDDGAQWFDLTIARDDPRWLDDVGRAVHWVGEWLAAAASLLGADAEVHRGRLVDDAGWGSALCFAGRGPGEVLVGGAKLAGISQRRSRDRARFQVVTYERWDPEPLLELLVEGPDLDLARGWGTDLAGLGVDAAAWSRALVATAEEFFPAG